MAVAEPDQSAGAPVQQPARRPLRRVLRGGLKGTLRLVALTVLSALGFTLAALVLVGALLLNGPLTLPDWVADRAEAQVNSGLGAGRISLDRLEVALGPGGAPQVRLRNVGIFDARGTEVARLNEIGAGFDPAALKAGRVLPEALALSGAQITIRRRYDGGFDLSFGRSVNSSGTLGDVLDRIDGFFTDGPLAAVERIGASDLTITLEDARSSRFWQVTDGRLLLEQDDASVGIIVNFDVFNGTEELASTALTIRSDKRSQRATLAARIRNAASGDIALQSPVLAFLAVLDAPISGGLRLSLGADGALEAFSGSLDIGAGRLDALPGGAPLEVDAGRADFSFDPVARRIDFADLAVESDRAAVRMSGQTYLEDLRAGGWPQSFVGQFRLLEVRAQDPAWLPGPVQFDGGTADLRLSLDPFRLDLGALVLRDGSSTLRASGSAAIGPDGSELALDLAVDRIGRARLMQLWPLPLAPLTRDWVAANVLAGTVTDARAAIRKTGAAPERRLLGFRFEEASVRFMETMPPIEAGSGRLTLAEDRLVVNADAGTLAAPEGGTADLAGTVFIIPDVRQKPQPAEVRLRAEGPIHAALSLLDQEPLRLMQRAGQPVALADGRVRAEAVIALELKPGQTLEDISYDVTARLSAVQSDVLVPGKTFAAEEMVLAATPDAVRIEGPAVLGALPVEVRWRQGLGPEAGPGVVEGEVDLSEAFLREFAIDLPAGLVRGEGKGDIRLDLSEDGPPRFRLTSDLKGLTLRIESLGWTKAAGSSGRLLVEGQLGDRPEIDRIEIEGGGLTAAGSIELTPDGGLQAARFERVRLGGWLDAPVVLEGRGRGAQPGVRVTGGSLDFRKASFGDGGSGGGGGTVPVAVALDRLYVAEGITLTSFRGQFTTGRGFGGRFTARLNGGGEILGTVAPQPGGSALRVTSENAGDVLKDANLAQRVRGGAMEMVLVPTSQEGVYNGSLTAQRVRVRGTPALAALLDAISVVGLLQQLNGDGIVFDNVQARFTLTPNAVNFRRSSAVGASLGISVEGLYELGTGRLDLQGVFSPVYLVNGIGAILTRRGEGLFGFNYRVTGTSETPKVQVNPLSILTPGMFREIFRAPPPKMR